MHKTMDPAQVDINAVHQLIDAESHWMPTGWAVLQSIPTPFFCVSIIGPQGGGKSFLLKTMFDAPFEVRKRRSPIVQKEADEDSDDDDSDDEDICRSDAERDRDARVARLTGDTGDLKTTQGIWFAFRVVDGMNILIFDVQGFDCIQSDKLTPGPIDIAFAAFVLQMSHVLMINVEQSAIGQSTGGGLDALEKVFTAVRPPEAAQTSRNTPADEGTLRFWEDVMTKRTCCKFIWRNVTNENEPSSAAVKKNMKEIWKTANRNSGDFVKNFPVKKVLPFAGFSLPVPFPTAKRPEDSAKLFGDFKTDVMRLRREIVDHLRDCRTMSAENASKFWDDSTQMSHSVRWAGSVGDQRVRSECEALRTELLTEYQRSLSDFDSRARELKILRASTLAKWTERLSPEARRRAHVVEQQGTLLVGQLQNFEEIEQARRRAEEEHRREQARQQLVVAREAEENNAGRASAARLTEAGRQVAEHINAFQAAIRQTRLTRDVFENQLALVRNRCEDALSEILTEEDELEQAQQRLESEIALLRAIWRSATFEQAEHATAADWTRLTAGLADWSAELGRNFLNATADVILTSVKVAATTVIAGGAVVAAEVACAVVGGAISLGVDAIMNWV